MGDTFFIMQGDSRRGNSMADAEWWFCLSPLQKRMHLFVDSNIEDQHIDLILGVYGETKTSLEEAEETQK